MNITTKPSQVKTPVSKPSTPKNQPPKDNNSSIVRDIAAIGAGAGGAVAGGIYGLGEGLVKNGIENFPLRMAQGAKIGEAIATPLGGVAGAFATGLTVGLAAASVPLTIVLGGSSGFIVGTASESLRVAPSTIKETASKGASLGEKALKGLGQIGEFTGRSVGGALGGIAGAFVALAKGLPMGLETAKFGASAGIDTAKGLPKFAKSSWKATYHGGRKLAGGAGSIVGGGGGVVAATGETIVEGVANGYSKGKSWAKTASDFVSGDKPKN